MSTRLLRDMLSGLSTPTEFSSLSLDSNRRLLTIANQMQSATRVMIVSPRLTANHCWCPCSLYTRLVRILVVVSATNKAVWKRNSKVWYHFKSTAVVSITFLSNWYGVHACTAYNSPCIIITLSLVPRSVRAIRRLGTRLNRACRHENTSVKILQIHDQPDLTEGQKCVLAGITEFLN